MRRRSSTKAPLRPGREHLLAHGHQVCAARLAGDIFLKEVFNLTIEETVRRYLTSGAWHSALNLVPTTVSLSHATLERYVALLAKEDVPAQRRLASRRAEQATDAFRENGRIRAGGESVNSGLKRRTGMGRVRTRGSPRVWMAVMFRCAGWNLFRAPEAPPRPVSRSQELRDRIHRRRRR